MFHVKLVTLLSVITFHQVWTYESFNDFPLTLDNGDYIIHATLTDLNSEKKYFLKEYIHSSSKAIRGKISLNLDPSSIDVHYSLNAKDQRLVVQDYDCNTFNYKSDWDKKIPGITESLLNHILLIGPSLIYRLKHIPFEWITGVDTEVRGISMKSAYTMVGEGKLNVTVHYKDTLTMNMGLSRPSQLRFIGYEPSDGSSTVKQNLILDILQQIRTDEELDKILIPKPGIGCPTYFSPDNAYGKNYYTFVKDSVHYISIENVNGPTHSRTVNEVYADEENQISSLKTTSQGITTEAFYDYILGIQYVKSDGGCLVSPIGLHTPGVSGDDLHKPFKINHLIDSGFYYKYLGETWLDNQLGFRTDVWESIVYDEKISGQRYDKVVATIYTVDSDNGDTDSGMIPVSVTLHGYNKSPTGSYSLIEWTRKDYYNFGQKIKNDELNNRFQISDCYPKPEDRKTLAIQFNCENKDCDYAIRKHNFAFKEQLKEKIISSGTISSARIGNLEIVLDVNSILAYVTFLNYPNLSRAFESTYLHLAISSDIPKYVSFTSDSSISCLKRNSLSYTTFEAVVYCSGDKSCFKIGTIGDLVEDTKNGKVCTVYYVPFKNLYRYNRETPLDNIQNELKGRDLSLFFNTGRSMIQYTASRVDEIVEPGSESRQLFVVGNSAAKLRDGKNTVLATSVSNFGDCYRACANLQYNDCETFSYCQWPDKTECLLSSLVYPNVSDDQVSDSNCQIYRKNRLQDYIKIANRELMDLTSVPTKHPINDCADLCSQSDECFSFQITNNIKCSFGGHYTDSTTKYSRISDIYIPKVAHKYAPTGKKIVTETFHTELSLTLDQCAALCYNTKYNDGDCLSYNFCPKGRTASSCSLSKYSVKDPSTNTSDSTVCTNYELISDKYVEKNQNPEVSSVNGTSGAGAFGIIVLFIGVGLVLGLTGPFVYNKSKSIITNLTSSPHDEVNWKRHSDKENQETSSI